MSLPCVTSSIFSGSVYASAKPKQKPQVSDKRPNLQPKSTGSKVLQGVGMILLSPLMIAGCSSSRPSSTEETANKISKMMTENRTYGEMAKELKSSNAIAREQIYKLVRQNLVEQNNASEESINKAISELKKAMGESDEASVKSPKPSTVESKPKPSVKPASSGGADNSKVVSRMTQSSHAIKGILTGKGKFPIELDSNITVEDVLKTGSDGDDGSMGIAISLKVKGLPSNAAEVRGIIVTNKEWPGGAAALNNGGSDEQVTLQGIYIHPSNEETPLRIEILDDSGNVIHTAPLYLLIKQSQIK